MSHFKPGHKPVIILASKSPRRCALLKKAGLEFSVIPSAYDEETGLDMEPGKLAEHLALKKAEDIASYNTAALAIGADTVVVVDGTVLGQPRNHESARQMLEKLSGRAHSVISAYALVCPEKGIKKVRSAATKVYFRELSASEIDAYIKSGEPMDKAGAYAIQGGAASFVEKIDGDYYNVVGLPVGEVMRDLKEMGY